MTGRELQNILDDIGLSETEAARLLYITPNSLLQYVNGQRRIPGPLVAAVEAWQRHGPPPGATLLTERIQPGQLKLMKELRDSLAPDADTTPTPRRRKRKTDAS